MKRYLPFVIIGLVLIGSVTSGAIFYHTKKQRIIAAKAATAEAARRVSASAKRGAEPAHARGPADAAVTLEEFGDFQCRPCGDLSPILEKLEQDYPTQLRVIFRQFPLGMHIHALDAARASEAAGLQNHFWEMHDLLYHNRFLWPRQTKVRPVFAEYARLLGLDVERFNRDMDGDEVNARITADQLRGKSLGVDRTPVLLIDHREVPVSSLNPPALHALVDQALEKNRAAATTEKK
jgi:protein-disulfide isomerase